MLYQVAWSWLSKAVTEANSCKCGLVTTLLYLASYTDTHLAHRDFLLREPSVINFCCPCALVKVTVVPDVMVEVGKLATIYGSNCYLCGLCG